MEDQFSVVGSSLRVGLVGDAHPALQPRLLAVHHADHRLSHGVPALCRLVHGPALYWGGECLCIEEERIRMAEESLDFMHGALV